MNFKFKKNRGFELVEVIVAVSIATFSIIAVWKVYTMFLRLSLSNPALFQASFLAEEGVEAVKFIRDTGWSNVGGAASGTPYTLIFTGTGWATTTAVSMIDGQFDRRVVFGDVYRDSSGNISESGTLDPGTRKVSVTVDWQKDGATSTKEIITYVTKIFN